MRILLPFWSSDRLHVSQQFVLMPLMYERSMNTLLHKATNRPTVRFAPTGVR